jgi:hypothetical protein
MFLEKLKFGFYTTGSLKKIAFLEVKFKMIGAVFPNRSSP